MQYTSSQNKLNVLYIMLALLIGLSSAKAVTIPPESNPRNVSLGWNASSATNVTGYRIYSGTTSGNYTNIVTVGNVLAATISNLTCGATYYFTATAIDATGKESVYSNEATFIVPGALTLSAGATPGSPMLIKFPVAVSHWYEVQASVDMQSWTTIWSTAVATSNVWVQYSDPQASAFPSRFYRLVLH